MGTERRKQIGIYYMSKSKKICWWIELGRRALGRDKGNDALVYTWAFKCIIYLNEEVWEETGEDGVTHLNGYQVDSFTYEFGAKREIRGGDLSLRVTNVQEEFKTLQRNEMPSGKVQQESRGPRTELRPGRTSRGQVEEEMPVKKNETEQPGGKKTKMELRVQEMIQVVLQPLLFRFLSPSPTPSPDVCIWR